MFWRRDVDNTCKSLLIEEIDQFHDHLNGLGPQFKREVEEEGCLPFLDVHLRRNIEDGSASIFVFRKKKHTNQYY